MTPARAGAPFWVLAVAFLAFVSTVSACGRTAAAQAPRCGSIERVALIAQSVPSSSYVPCIIDLPTGWRSGPLTVHTGRTSFSLLSDRSPGRPVQVDVAATCTTGTATPIAPRTPGGRTYLELQRIDPRYTGTMYDVFPGGCVIYRFDFERGAHIALMAQLQSTVGFVSRQQLRRDLQAQLGIRLDP